MLLVLTGSGDFTANYIFERLGDNAFRLNFDLFSDYTLNFSPERWEISNPTGLTISSEIATACFWWKPFNFFIEQEKYVVEEVKYVFRELYSWFKIRNMTKGNSGLFHQNLGKINILSMARKHFRIPDSEVFWGPRATSHLRISSPVAKSLTSGLMATDKALYTTPVDSSLLDLRYPWFLQEKIDADYDITVQYVGTKIFGFARSRHSMKTLDWRQEIFTPEMERSAWNKIDISKTLNSALRNFACDLGVNWGRVDLIGSLEDPYFLEFNANGQWMFLDPDVNLGLADAVIEYLQEESRGK